MMVDSFFRGLPLIGRRPRPLRFCDGKSKPKLLPHHDLLIGVDAVDLKHVLGDIQTDRGNLHLDGSPHVIRLRRPPYGTSMPGAGAVHHINFGLMHRSKQPLLFSGNPRCRPFPCILGRDRLPGPARGRSRMRRREFIAGLGRPQNEVGRGDTAGMVQLLEP